jgi:hypothetical protein
LRKRISQQAVDRLPGKPPPAEADMPDEPTQLPVYFAGYEVPQPRTGIERLVTDDADSKEGSG